MKTVLKWLGIVLGFVVVIAGCLAAYINFRPDPTYDVALPAFTSVSTPESVHRGKILVLSLCAECHRDPVTKQLTGRLMQDLPEQFGTAYSRNITQHPTKGIGAWSDAEIAWLLRTGIHPKTKKYVPAWMVKLPHVSDQDMNAIISFLRSDDPLVVAADVQNRESDASLFAKFLMFVGAFKPYDYPTAAIAHPDTTNSVKYGEYLADNVFACFACHSKDFASNDDMTPTKSAGYYGGGNMMPDYNKVLVPTSNITPDKATGIGAWTEAQFVSTMKHGFRPDGSLLRYPMGRLAHVSDHELSCIYAYLKTIPSISNAVPKPPMPAMSANPSAGEKAYNSYGCVHCHGASGLGFADLQLADKKYSSDSVLTDVILHTTTYYPETAMPAWDGKIKPADLPEIVKHVRDLGKKSGR
ncbi:MAG: c-type cytochrome [Candidatus Kapabacteria bacterium]|nr:c-type cytochrome [Candidatus Kapabacteria bacterium]